MEFNISVRPTIFRLRFWNTTLNSKIPRELAIRIISLLITSKRKKQTDAAHLRTPWRFSQSCDPGIRHSVITYYTIERVSCPLGQTSFSKKGRRSSVYNIFIASVPWSISTSGASNPSSEFYVSVTFHSTSTSSFVLLQRFHSAMYARARMSFQQYKIVRSNRKRRRRSLYHRTCSLFNDVRFDQYLGVSRNDPTRPSYARAYISIYERVSFSGEKKKKLTRTRLFLGAYQIRINDVQFEQVLGVHPSLTTSLGH